MPFIIFLTPVSCDGSNRLWRQRLLLSPCSLWRHKQTLIGVIRPLAGGKCRTFRRVIERYRFHRYLCFHCVFCVRVFCILFSNMNIGKAYRSAQLCDLIGQHELSAEQQDVCETQMPLSTTKKVQIAGLFFKISHDPSRNFRTGAFVKSALLWSCVVRRR